MTRVCITRCVAGALLAAVVALPLGAQSTVTNDAAAAKRRAARLSATLTGTVTDASSNAPVFECEVVVQGQTVLAGANGQYKIGGLTSGQASVTFQRWGYVASSQTVSVAVGSTTLNARLAPKAVTTVTDKAGATHRYDYELSQFGYLIPFAGYARSDSIPLCAADGARSTINKADLKSVSSVSRVASGCCPASGGLQTATFTFKDGTSSVSGFFDSCSSTEEYFVARDRDTGQWAYLKLTDLTQIAFP
jgi:Carboxypeptidase regulatory-like domain